MNISDVLNLIEGASYENKVSILKNICDFTGDCIQNGFLGSSVSNISYDEFGYVEFQSEKSMENFSVSSKGTVLDESVIIMQIQKSNGIDYWRLYSWKLDGSCYTVFDFDCLKVLEIAYIGLKKMNALFLSENIDEILSKVGISYRDVLNINVAVLVEKNNCSEKLCDEFSFSYFENVICDTFTV